MKTIKLIPLVLLPFWGLVGFSCTNSVSNGDVKSYEMPIPIWEDTARPVIEGFIRWYEDRNNIPLLQMKYDHYEGDSSGYLGNIPQWGDSLKRCKLLSSQFIDSIIPAIKPDYESYFMDYGYPISHIGFSLESKYPPISDKRSKYYRPFYGLDSMIQVTCKIQPDSILRCTYTLGKGISHDFVTWLKKENGRWLIWQWDTYSLKWDR